MPLRATLENLRNQSSVASSGFNSQEIDSTVERLSACEMEMTALKERIEKLEGVVQEEDMQARRGKSVIMVGTKTFARMTEEQFAAILVEKECEYMRLLKQQKDELRRKMQEEMNTKLRDLSLEHKVALQERDHKMALQEKELQIKELELNKARMRQETSAASHHEDIGSETFVRQIRIHAPHSRPSLFGKFMDDTQCMYNIFA